MQKKYTTKMMKRLYAIAMILLAGIILFSCKKEKDASVMAKEELIVSEEEGFCATQTFENNTWTFGKKVLPNGDIMLDKSLRIKGNLPDCTKRYDLTLIVDFYPEIECETLPLDITTITPDGNSKQSTSLKVDFNDKELVKEIEQTESERAYKRYSKVLYPQKKFTASGDYTFDIYSKYTKVSLSGIKSISIKLIENNSEK